MACFYACFTFLRDALRGVALLVALGGLSFILLGIHALAPLGATAADINVAWFGWVLLTLGGLSLLLGLAASVGPSLSRNPAPLHCFTGATLVLLPLEALLVWAYCTHHLELRRLADRDQTYVFNRILDWVDVHQEVSAGLAAIWLVLQAAAVLLGSCVACFPRSRRHKHPWDRYWNPDSTDDLQQALLLPAGRAEARLPSGPGSPRADGYHTPSSRFASPYQSPGRAPRVVVVPQAVGEAAALG